MALWQAISYSSATCWIWLVRVPSKPISHENGCHMHFISIKQYDNRWPQTITWMSTNTIIHKEDMHFVWFSMWDGFFSPRVSESRPSRVATRVGFGDEWWEIHLTWKTIQNAFSRILYTLMHFNQTKYNVQSCRSWNHVRWIYLTTVLCMGESQKYARSVQIICVNSLSISLLMTYINWLIDVILKSI